MPHITYGNTLPRPNDPDLLESLERLSRDGFSHRAIAAKLGIAKATFTEWIGIGRDQLARGEEHGSHAAFAARLESGYAALEESNLQYIMGARSTKGAGWMPAMAMLRSRNPEEWVEKPDRGSNVTVNVGTVQVLNASLTPSQALALSQLLAEQARGVNENAIEGVATPTLTTPAVDSDSDPPDSP